jgi:hypothetical protein
VDITFGKSSVHGRGVFVEGAVAAGTILAPGVMSLGVRGGHPALGVYPARSPRLNRRTCPERYIEATVVCQVQSTAGVTNARRLPLLCAQKSTARWYLSITAGERAIFPGHAFCS